MPHILSTFGRDLTSQDLLSGQVFGRHLPIAPFPVVTTKGDVFGFSTVAARVPIGGDGQVLTADSAQLLGLKWATPTGGVGSGGALSLVEAKSFGADATSYTFSGLNGDADGIYCIMYRLILKSTTERYEIRPNGLNTNQEARSAITSGDTPPVNLPNGTGFLLLAGHPSLSLVANDFLEGHAWFYPKTGVQRVCMSTNNGWRAVDSKFFWCSQVSVWNETATNITSFDIVANIASGIGAGSFVKIYKLLELSTALTPTWGRVLAVAGA